MIRLLAFLVRFATTVAGVLFMFWLLRDRLVHLTPRRSAFVSPLRPAPADIVPPLADITEVKGIGPVFAERLASRGIVGLEGLAASDAGAVAAAAGVTEDRAAEWITEAESRR